MPIVPSRAGRVRELVRQLTSRRAVDRDSAVAQLTLLGPRVIEPLVSSLHGAPVGARLATVEVLARLDDPRTLAGLETLSADPSKRVALEAMEAMADGAVVQSVPILARLLAGGTPPWRREAAGRALAGLHRAGVVEALAPLVDAVVDEQAAAELRLSLLDEILRLDPPLPRSTLRPLGRRLARSRVPVVAARGEDLGRETGRGRARPGAAPDPIEGLVRGRLTASEVSRVSDTLRRDGDPPLDRLHDGLASARDPEVIGALARVLADVGTASSIPVLARALARVGGGADPRDHPGRLAARAALHVALARLDSRVALHDLRELVSLRPPEVLPEVLEAVATVGDGSLVPALARVASEEPSLLPACADACAAIARRHRLRRSSPALRKVRPEHRDALEALLRSRSRRR